MSGHTDEYETTNDVKEWDELKQTLAHINVEGLEEMLKIWYELYGPTSIYCDRITKLIDDIKVFWECQLEKQNERKRNLAMSIEQAGKNALRLEKILGLKAEVQHLTCDNDVPLVTLEDNIWKLLNSYQEMSNKRLEEYSLLQKREEELCAILGAQPQIKNEFLENLKNRGTDRKESFIPTSDNMSTYKERIAELEKQKEQLEYDFEKYREKLQSLLDQCEVSPNTEIARYLCSENDEFPVTSQNVQLLKSTSDQFQHMLNDMISEAEHLRNDVLNIGKKMLLDKDELQTFLRQNNGFSKTMINNLKDKLRQLKEERKNNLKDLITSHRKVLNEQWKKCCFSEEEKSRFKPNQTNHYSEEVLDLIELEIEKMKHFYEQNKRIFQLAEKYEDLWKRLLHLEELATNKDRLFNNRGGCLLKEEKERKLIQKKVPTIRAELLALIEKYKEGTGKDFLLYGVPLEHKIEQMDEQREQNKENEKLLRKAKNDENLFMESRIGARPTPSGNKRRLLTPQHQNNYSKVIKSTAHSTPQISRSASTLCGSDVKAYAGTRVLRENELRRDSWLHAKPRHTRVIKRLNCDTPHPASKIPQASSSYSSLSYESFQEHLTKPSSNRSHEKCKQPAESRVLRPRNENRLPGKCVSEKKINRGHTPISRLATRSATGSKIPRSTTPSAPRPATPVTRTRRRLPIIF